MTLFAIALLIIATIVQLIRVEYTTEGAKNSKGSILGIAIKSLGKFVLIPLICVVGVGISTTLLKAVDRATSQGGGASISGSIFLAGAAEANVLRTGERDAVSSGYLISSTGSDVKIPDDGMAGEKVNLWNVFGVTKAGSDEAQKATLASAIDASFGSSKENCVKVPDGSSWGKYQEGQALYYGNPQSVNYFYNFGDMNFIVLYLGAGFALVCLFKASFGLIMRMYKITALFIISPGVIALEPLDGGNAYKGWRKNFIGTTLGAFGVVISLNLFFFLIGTINSIKLFPESNTLEILNNGPINYWIKAVFTLVGLLMINDLSKQISGYIGADDALGDGSKMAGDVAKKATKFGGMAAKGVVMGKALGGSLLTGRFSQAARDAKVLQGKTAQVKEAGAEATQAESALNDYVKNYKGDNIEQDEKYKQLKEAAGTANEKLNSARAMSPERLAKASALLAKREQQRLIFAEMRDDFVQGSGLVSFANKFTGGFIGEFGGKAMKGITEKAKAGNEAIFDAAGSYEGGKFGKFGSVANMVLTGGWGSKIQGNLEGRANSGAKIVMETADQANGLNESLKSVYNSLAPSTVLAKNNADFRNIMNDVMSSLSKANNKAQAEIMVKPLLEKLEKLNKTMEAVGGKSEGRSTVVNSLKDRLASGNFNGIADIAKGLDLNAEQDKNSDAYKKYTEGFASLKKNIDEKMGKYVKDVTEGDIKLLISKFDATFSSSPNTSMAEEFERVLKAQKDKLEKKAEEYAAKNAKKKSEEAFAKMIAKFMK